VKARVQSPDARSEDITMSQTAPGRYEGHFEAGAKGNYMFTVLASGKDAGNASSLHFGFNLSKFPEDRPSSSDQPYLNKIAAATNGRVWNTRTITSMMSGNQAAYSDSWIAAAILALLFFLCDAWIRTRGIPVR
jgi:hypothetical protein